jgi:hypothetical protein
MHPIVQRGSDTAMNDLIEIAETYARSDVALLHTLCVVVSFLNQFVVIRNIVRIVRTAKLGMWPVWGPILGATLAVDDFLIKFGYGILVAVITAVMFSLDLIFFKLGSVSRSQ